MNSKSSRKNYGIMPLSASLTRAVQLEWAMVESPARSARFLNFPLTEVAPLPASMNPPRGTQKRKLPSAA